MWVSVPVADGPNQTQFDEDNGDAAGQNGREAGAIDVSLPEGGSDTHTKPTLVILAGLTGGCREAYVQDLVNAANAEGSSRVCVCTRVHKSTYVFLDLVLCSHMMSSVVWFIHNTHLLTVVLRPHSDDECSRAHPLYALPAG